MAALEAPKNHLVSVMNAVFDALIKGLGVEVAYAAAVAQMPFLGVPIVCTLFRYVLTQIASVFDDGLKKNADIIVIRIQNDARKAEYEAAIKPLKSGHATDADLKAARDAIDNIVNRSR